MTTTTQVADWQLLVDERIDHDVNVFGAYTPVAGDIHLLVVGYGNDNSVIESGAPAGYTIIDSASTTAGSDHSLVALYKVLDGEEEDPMTIQGQAAEWMYGRYKTILASIIISGSSGADFAPQVVTSTAKEDYAFAAKDVAEGTHEFIAVFGQTAYSGLGWTDVTCPNFTELSHYQADAAWENLKILKREHAVAAAAYAPTLTFDEDAEPHFTSAIRFGFTGSAGGGGGGGDARQVRSLLGGVLNS